MASRGRGRAVRRPAASITPPGGLQTPADADPVGEAALADEFRDLSITNLQFATRPDYATRGKIVRLVTNHFPIKMPKTQELFHFEISIEQGQGRNKLIWTSGKANGLPRNEIRDRCYSVYLQFVKDSGLNLYQLFYDRQKNLYSLNDLYDVCNTQRSKVVKCDGVTYSVMLFVCDPPKIVISPETIGKAAMDTSKNSFDRSPMQVLDVIFNQFLFYLRAVEKTEYIHFGRYFYRPYYDNRNKLQELPYGRVIYEGFFKSLRVVMGPKPLKPPPAAGSADVVFLTMNVDAKKAPFFVKQRLLWTVLQTLGCENENQAPKHRLSDDDVKHLNKHLKEIRVCTTHTPMKRCFVMCSFTNVPAINQKFKLADGSETNVFDYTREKFGVSLKYPNLPSVRKRGAQGDPKGYTYFPIEVCEIVAHQKVDLKKTTEKQSKELIRCSAVPPEQRLMQIKEYGNQIDVANGNVQNNPFLKEIGIERSQKLMEIDARQVEPPMIQFNSKEVLFKDPNGHGKFTQNLVRTCRSHGITISNDYNGDYLTEAQLDPFFKQCAQQGQDFIICIMEERPQGDRLKNAVKLGEVKFSVITQCVIPQTIRKCCEKPNDDIYRGLAQKINMKNGGVNNDIVINDPIAQKWYRQGIMYVGYDVNHPPALSKAEIAQGMEPKEPSVIGSVANCGRSISDYRGRFYLQDARQEECAARHLNDMITYFVKEYAQNNDGRRPESVIVYRDGVSESQFDMVLNREMAAVKHAFSVMTPAYSPKLTVITVQKRHNTRFFTKELTETPLDKLRTMKAGQKNIQPGTVVDVGPVSSRMNDFYLCSHVAIQGTTKASHYAVLYDENKFSANELHGLTFILCHCYQRCTKSVSLPAPVYHAHHVAARGKALYSADAAVNAEESSSSGFSSISSDNSSPSRANSRISYDAIQARIQSGPIICSGMTWA